jgi:hypothetical protein
VFSDCVLGSFSASPNSNSNSNGNLGIRPKTISNGEVCRAIFKTGIGESGNLGILESGNPGIGESGNRGILESC